MSLAPRNTALAVWLYIVAASVGVMVVVGGITRLTDSGLSITEWQPVTGVLLPLSEAAWFAEFEKYKASGEYQLQNAGMSLAAFKFIYFWEWVHRLLGRLVGLLYAVPFAWFLLHKRVPEWLTVRLWVLLGLGALQGFIGWWMVKSGLVDRVDVLPERLATHLGLAVLIFAILLWTAREARLGQKIKIPVDGSAVILGLVFVQILLGALVAGNDAGKIYTDWPLMDGALVPDSYWQAGQGLWANLFHNHAMVQFHHRLGGYVVAALGVWAWVRYGRMAFPFFMVAALQTVLGITTVMTAAPVGLALAHQVLALALIAKAGVLAQNRTLK